MYLNFDWETTHKSTYISILKKVDDKNIPLFTTGFKGESSNVF